MRFVDLTISEDESLQSPLTGQLATSATTRREELLAWGMSVPDLLLNQLYFVTGDLNEYESILNDVDTITQYDLNRVGERRFYAYIQLRDAHENTPWWSVFRRRNVLHVPPIVIRDETIEMTLTGEEAELQTVVADLEEMVNVEVTGLGEFNGRGGQLTGRLTGRQLQALRVARNKGYFELPREGSLTEVADHLGCTESTASALIRRAERALIDVLLARQHPT